MRLPLVSAKTEPRDEGEAARDEVSRPESVRLFPSAVR